MNDLLMLLAAAFLVTGCKNSKPENTTEFFPVNSFLKSQVKHVDTSLYRIIKIETADGKSDTSYLRREEFSRYAKEFIEVPDISSKKLKNDYEETQIVDESLESIILTYTTDEKENEVQRQDVLLAQQNIDGNNEVSAIIIHTYKNEKNRSVERNMVWYVNKSFVIITKTNSGNAPEKISKLEIIWNDPRVLSKT